MQSNTKKTLQYFIEAGKKYKLSGSLMLLGVTISALCDVITPLYMRNFFNVLAGGDARDIAIKALMAALVFIAIFKFGQWLGWRITSFAVSIFELNVMADLSNKCFAYLHKHSFSYFNDNFSGTIVKRVKWFTGAFENITDNLIWSIVPLIIRGIFILVVLFQLNIGFGWGIITWFLIFAAVNYFFIKRKYVIDVQRNEAESSSTGLLADTISNHSTVKLFNGYDRENQRYADSVNEVKRLRRKSWFMHNWFDSAQGFLMVMLEVGVLYFAARLWMAGRLQVGDFILIQSYLMTIFMHLWDFGRVIRGIYERLSDAEEMTIMLSTSHEIQDAPRAKQLSVDHGVIEFKNVQFNYNQTREIFKKFNLHIKAGERVALIGSSGAGKTTIIKLLLRMHDIAGGRIMIDGEDIAKVTQESLWKNVSLVPQDPILFHRSLMENIRYGRPEATDEEVVSAAKAAHCHEFVSDTPEGYNTFVGERGIKLSGGERQRIAIARAILRNSPILVLDEATSSLDSESEMFIQDALANLMRGKTVIVVAHRLSTIRQMDRIIVIENGTVVEDGGHEELARQENGIYHKLWKLQAGGFIE